jgi:hypothetical protein
MEGVGPVRNFMPSQRAEDCQSHGCKIDLRVRLEPQMRLINWFIQGLIVFVFLVLLFGPHEWGFPLGLVAFAAMGFWALLFPQGALGTVKRLRGRANDPSLWWVPRLVGAFFVAFALIGALAIVFHPGR